LTEIEQCLLCPNPLPEDPFVFVCDKCSTLIADQWSKRLEEQLQGLPEENATKSRDYGRGYAQAIRDVLKLLDKEDS